MECKAQLEKQKNWKQEKISFRKTEKKEWKSGKLEKTEWKKEEEVNEKKKNLIYQSTKKWEKNHDHVWHSDHVTFGK